MACSRRRVRVLKIDTPGEFVMEERIAFAPRGRVSGCVANGSRETGQAIALESDSGGQVKREV